MVWLVLATQIHGSGQQRADAGDDSDGAVCTAGLVSTQVRDPGALSGVAEQVHRTALRDREQSSGRGRQLPHHHEEQVCKRRLASLCVGTKTATLRLTARVTGSVLYMSLSTVPTAESTNTLRTVCESAGQMKGLLLTVFFQGVKIDRSRPMWGVVQEVYQLVTPQKCLYTTLDVKTRTVNQFH